MQAFPNTIHNLAPLADPIAYCDAHADELVARYESVSFEKVHGNITLWLPRLPASVLDVGAGSGRDANWLANRGYDVLAVEPSKGLRERGQRLHLSPRLRWINDNLPYLPRVMSIGLRYDFILLSAVLMFLPPLSQAKSLSTLASLLLPQGRLVLTVRLGPSDPKRGLFALSEQYVRDLLKFAGSLTERSWSLSEDCFSRHGVKWVSVVLEQSKPRSNW